MWIELEQEDTAYVKFLMHVARNRIFIYSRSGLYERVSQTGFTEVQKYKSQKLLHDEIAR